MHKSKLAGFIIDCDKGDLPSAANFWGAALGMRVRPFEDEQAAKYVKLDNDQGLAIEVQRVDHASRVHLDIETDDIEAEVKRLEGLGARRVESVRTWVVMQAPTGHRFCVIRAASTDFATRACCWK